MTQRPTQTFKGPRFTADQRLLLDAIGEALKRRQLSFAVASALGEQVKAGDLGAVTAALESLPAAE